MLAQTKLTVKQYYVVRTIRMGKCAYAAKSKGNAIGEVNRAIVNWWRGSGFWGINKRARLERGQLQILKQEDLVCIGEIDHLPRKMRASDGRFITDYECNPTPAEPVAP